MFHRDEVDHLKLGVVIRELSHEEVLPVHHGRHGTNEVGDDGLKPLRDLGLARVVANWLFGAVVDLVNIVRSQRVGKIDSRLSDVPPGLHGAFVRIFQALMPDVRPPAPLWQLLTLPMQW